MADKYDDAIAYLTEHPNEIFYAWRGYDTHPAGCLFAMVSTTGEDDFERCGCLTMIRMDDEFEAPTSALTMAIRSDERIPDDPRRVQLSHLPVFAEWQRRLDRELGRG